MRLIAQSALCNQLSCLMPLGRGLGIRVNPQPQSSWFDACRHPTQPSPPRRRQGCPGKILRPHNGASRAADFVLAGLVPDLYPQVCIGQLGYCKAASMSCVLRDTLSERSSELVKEFLSRSASRFPGGSRGPCVPRMMLNLEVRVLFGPQGAEPIAKGNCVAAMRGGEEAGGKTGGRRTESGYKANAVGQPGMGRGHPILLLFIARVDPTAASGKCSVLPWETSPALRANRSRVSVTASDGWGGVSRGRSSGGPQGRRKGPNL